MRELKQVQWLRVARGQGNCYQWKTKEQCSKRDKCNFWHNSDERAKQTTLSSEPPTQRGGSASRKETRSGRRCKTSWKVFALNLWHLASSRMDGVHWRVATSTSKWTANERASLNTAKWFWLNDKDDTSLSLSVVLMCRYDSPEKGFEPECVCFSNEGKFVIYWKEDTSCVSSLQSRNENNVVLCRCEKGWWQKCSVRTQSRLNLHRF